MSDQEVSTYKKYRRPLTEEMIQAGSNASQGAIGYKLLGSAVAAIWAAMERVRKEQAIAEAEREMTRSATTQDQRTL